MPDLDIDDKDKPEVTTNKSKADTRARQGDDGRPFCSLHMCLMVAAGGNKSVTNYRCPVPTCQAAEKKARPNIPIARKPLTCPHCEKQERVSYLARDQAQHSPAKLNMTCEFTGCGFHVKIDRPDVALRVKQRKNTDDLSVR